MSFTQRLVQFRSLVRRGFLWIGFAAIFCFALGVLWSYRTDSDWLGDESLPPLWMINLVGTYDWSWEFEAFSKFLYNVALPYTMSWIVLELFTLLVPKLAASPPPWQSGARAEARAADGGKG